MAPFLSLLIQTFSTVIFVVYLVRAQDSGAAQAAESIYLNDHEGASATFDLSWGVGSTVTPSEVTVISSLTTTVTFSLNPNPVPVSTITTTTPQPGLTAPCPTVTPTSVPSFNLTSNSASSIPSQDDRLTPSGAQAHSTAASQRASGALPPLPQGSMFWPASGVGSAIPVSAISGVFYTGLAGNGTSWKLANSNIGLPYSPSRTPGQQGIAPPLTTSKDTAQSSLASLSDQPASAGAPFTSSSGMDSQSSRSSTNVVALVLFLGFNGFVFIMV